MTTMGAESFAAFHSSSSDHEVRSSSTQRQSAVAYLFGGIASMVGLIALAILILACAYWKLSGRFQDEEDQQGDGDGDGDGDLELQRRGQMKNDNNNGTTRLVEEKIFVIMAGDEKPTFIATPVTSSTTTNDDQELYTPPMIS